MFNKITLSALAAATILSCTASANVTDTVKSVKSKINISGDVRTRYETVEETGKMEAEAFTARVRLNVKANLTDNIKFEIEGNANKALVSDYSPEEVGFATVKDPEGSRLTQANVTLSAGNFFVKAGRQAVALDNKRHISNKGGKQTPQTFDAVVAGFSFKGANLTVGYVDKVHQIWHDNGTKAAEVDTDSVLLHFNKKFSNGLSLSVYDYMIADTADTIGVLAKGKTKMGKEKGGAINYELEYAIQKDPTRGIDKVVDTSFLNADLGYKMANGLGLGVGYASYEDGFSSGMGSGHKYLGLADAVSQGDVVDINGKIVYSTKKLGKMVLAGHNFESQAGVDKGSEIDFIYSKNINKNLAVKFIAAKFDSDTSEKTKYYGQAQYKF